MERLKYCRLLDNLLDQFGIFQIVGGFQACLA